MACVLAKACPRVHGASGNQPQASVEGKRIKRLSLPEAEGLSLQRTAKGSGVLNQ
jgi:hypothetical protein